MTPVRGKPMLRQFLVQKSMLPPLFGALATICALTGCSNLLKADFQSYATGAPPGGLPPGSAALVTTLLPGAPSGDSLGLSGHGGGTYNIVTSPSPAGDKALELGGTAISGICLSSAARFETIALTSANYDVRKPVSFTYNVGSSGNGNFRMEVGGRLAGTTDPDASPWRQLLQFSVRDGAIAETLSSTTRVPASFSQVTGPNGGTFTVLLSINEATNSWTASFILPNDVPRPAGVAIPRLEGSLRPELNFLAVPPTALSLSMALSDRVCAAGTNFGYLVDDVKIGQRQSN